MFIAHIRVGFCRDGVPATLMMSPTFSVSGVASVRRMMLSEFASMSQMTGLPLGSVVRTRKCTCGFCQATSTRRPSISMVRRSYSEPE